MSRAISLVSLLLLACSTHLAVPPVPCGTPIPAVLIAPDIEDLFYPGIVCPHCKAAGLKSCVYPGVSVSTLMYVSPGYYDEDGKWVANNDNPNYTETSYTCSRGHSFKMRSR